MGEETNMESKLTEFSEAVIEQVNNHKALQLQSINTQKDLTQIMLHLNIIREDFPTKNQNNDDSSNEHKESPSKRNLKISIINKIILLFLMMIFHKTYYFN